MPIRLLTALVLLAAAAAGQPYVYYRGAVNAASFVPPGLPGGALAQGGIFTLFGRNLGPATAAGAVFPLGAEVAGVSIEVCAPAGGCVAALPLFVSAGQINAILPSNAPLGRCSLRVRAAGVNGNWTPIDVAAAGPGLFSVNAAGLGPGVVQNFVSAVEVPLNSLAAPARPGGTVILYATGLGPSAAPDHLPAPGGNVGGPVEVFAGEQAATVLYAGRAPGFAGLDQINFTLPAATPEGCYVPVRVRTAGGAVSNTITIAVRNGAGRCLDRDNPLTAPVSGGQRLFSFLAHRVETAVDVDPLAASAYTSEWATAVSGSSAASDFAFGPLALPPRGACLAYTLRGNPLSTGAAFPFAAPAAIDLGAALPVSAGGRTATVPRQTGLAQYAARLSGALSAAADFFFAGASVSLSGPVAASIPTAAPVNWTNRAEVSRIDRRQPLTLRWSGGAATDEALLVAAIAEDVPIHAAGVLLCAADPAAGSFTVPASALAHLPVSRPRLWQAPALLLLGRIPARPAAPAAAGFDATFGAFAAWTAATPRITEGR